MKKRFWSLMLALIMVLGLIPVADLTVYAAENPTIYVSNEGSDTNDGTSKTGAVATISKAYEMVASGGTICLLSDVVLDSCVSLTDGKIVTIMSDSDAMVQNNNTAFTIKRGDSNTGRMFSITKGELILQNVVLDGESASGSKVGGGIYVDGETSKNAILTMNEGSVIKNNEATQGAGIYIYRDGKFNMNGGTITGNYASNSQGGGVWNNGTSKLLGGQISGNGSQSGLGTDVYNLAGLSVGGTVTVSDIYLYYGCTIAISSETPLANGAKIGVNTGYKPGYNDGEEVQIATNATDSDRQYFYYNMYSGARIILKESNLYITLALDPDYNVYVSADGDDTNGTGTRSKPFATLAKAYENVNTGGTIYLLSDIEVNDTLEINKNITIAIDDHSSIEKTIKRSNAGDEIFCVTSDGELTLRDVILDGSGTEGRAISTTGTVNLTNSTVVKNFCVSSADGGAIYIEDGILNMGEAVEISGNKSGASGGGLYVKDGIANISGYIRSNYAEKNGGGAYIESGTLNLINGNVLDNRCSDSGFGAGVYVPSNGRLTVGGYVSVFTNYAGSGSDQTYSNVYLDDTTITINAETPLTSGNIFVSAKDIPDSSHDVNIVTGASSNVTQMFYCDMGATKAGVVYCDGTSDSSDTLHTDHVAGTVWLSTAAAGCTIAVTVMDGIICDIPEQSDVKGAIKTITLSPDDGYAPLTAEQANALNDVLQQSAVGLTATLKDGTITIDGTPMHSMNIPLVYVFQDDLAPIRPEAKIASTYYATIADALTAAAGNDTADIIEIASTTVTAVDWASLKSGDTLKEKGGRTYKATSDSYVSVDTNGVVTFKTGTYTYEVELRDGESVTGGSGYMIENPTDSGDDTIKVEFNNATNQDTVTIPAGGKLTTDGNSNKTEITAGKKGATITLDNDYGNMSVTEGSIIYDINGITIERDKDDNFTLINGTFPMPDGLSVTGGSGKKITNPADSGSDTITLTTKGNKDTVIVPAGGKVIIDDKEYTADNDNDLMLTIDKDGKVTTEKSPAKVTTAPTLSSNKFTYDGTKQTIGITDGLASGGIIQYQVVKQGVDSTSTPDDDQWSTDQPKVKDAGTYDIYYKVKADEDHTDTDAVKLGSVTVAKKTQEIATPTVNTTKATRVILNAIADGENSKGEGKALAQYAVSMTNAAPTDDASWQTSTTFTGLSKNTTYYFFARYSGDDNYETVTSSALEVTTPDMTTGTLGGVSVIEGIADPGITYDGDPVKPGDIYTGTPYINGEETSDAEVTYTWYDTSKSPAEVIGNGANGGPTKPGSYTLVITAMTEDTIGAKEIAFTIVKKDPNAISASDFTGSDETIDGKHDGKISDVSGDYEYSTDNGKNWTLCTGTEISNLTPGTVKIRKKATDCYNASNEVDIVIKAGKKITLSLPENITYTITCDPADGVTYDGSATLTFEPGEGYTITEPLIVTIGGKEITFIKDAASGKYKATINNITDKDGLKVTAIKGYADTTKPSGSITLSDKQFTSFLNTITFGTFFKETEQVTLSATDAGSGLKAIYYYIAKDSEAIAESNLLSLDWKEYTGSFAIDPGARYIVYAKFEDKAGNISYVCSDGLVVDDTAPVVSGIESGKTYCAAREFTVTDSNLDYVKIDGNVVTASAGIYVLPADGNSHTVTIADKAGNSTTITNVMAKTGAHTYDKEVATEKYLKSTATCHTKAVYYKSCECGEAGTETFEYGDYVDHDFLGEGTIVKEATATEDGKKETACQYGCGTKKIETILATGKTEDDSSNGKLDKYTLVAKDAPVDDAALDTSKTDLLDASGIFTESEKTSIQNGQDAKIYLQIENVDSSEVSSADQTKINDAAKQNLGDQVVIDYMDISLLKQIGNADAEYIHEPGINIDVTIKIPSNMLLDQSGQIRKYRILSIHNGVVEVIKGTFNSDTQEFTFSTDKFSTYAIAYSDEAVGIDISTSDGNTTLGNIGDTIQLDVTVTPAEDADQSVIYKSSDTSVATVDANGKVTAVGNGKATITVTTADGSVSKTVVITVNAKNAGDNENTDGNGNTDNGNTDGNGSSNNGSTEDNGNTGDTANNANASQTVITSPKTGDTSNMTLCILVLMVIFATFAGCAELLTKSKKEK